MLRTFESQATGKNRPFTTGTPVLGKLEHDCLVFHRRETQKARKDTMPHERRLLPVLPTEFFCTALADPKARFCRSLAAIRQRMPEKYRENLTH
jgi:hypothetical protein